MEPFKNVYNKKSITALSKELAQHYKKFDQKAFLKHSLKNLESLEMKQRVVQISEAMQLTLPKNYKTTAAIIKKSFKSKKNPNGLNGFILWPISHFIESNGLDELDTSLDLLYHLTINFTSEFGIRPFIKKYENQIYKSIKPWCKDNNEHIRRFVSEGTRPNLPWGMKVKYIENNLKKNIVLLNALKEDPSEYVRKSVANHMNDITRIDADLALTELKKWNKIKTKEVQWIVKHALRSLLKQGHPEALKILGYSDKSLCSVSKLKINPSAVKEGQSAELNFFLTNKESKPAHFMVDYNIYYLKANGKHIPKTFKLKAVKLKKGETLDIRKSISFKKVTTRKQYSGIHFIEIQVNGNKLKKVKFNLEV